MCNYIIEGGRKLEGEACVSGSKNSSLPILAACILNGKENVLLNVPNIKDTKITIEILQLLGCKVTKSSDKIIVNSENIDFFEIPEKLMRELRSSVIMAGAIIRKI